MGDPQKRFPDRKIMGRHGPIPYVTIVKRDGRIQPFNRTTMIESIRSAGATQVEADLVTDRISRRLWDRESIPSTEVSSMVARSLSHVNTTVSQNYVENRNKKLNYTQQISNLSTEIAAISQNIDSVKSSIKNLDDRFQNLQPRITSIRQANYHVLTHLEADQASLSEEWKKLNQELQTTTNLKSELARVQIQDLQQALNSKLGSDNYDLNTLQDIESGISRLRLNLSEMQSGITNMLSPLEKKFESLDHTLLRAESTVSIVSQISFPWEENESPIVATKVKDLKNNIDGYVILTNHRFIFESEKEIALKKVLFVVTEKKTMREVVIQKPIGMISQMTHGKVGYFKGSGFFVEFASESGIPEMKFDTSDQDAEWIVECYNSVISGRVDKELATSTPTAPIDQEKLQLTTCPLCGAPYKEKIYRGETSVNCKYCGAAIAIRQRG